MTTRIINITTDWTITDGPSREALFDALRLFNEHRGVEFELLEREVSGQLRVNRRRIRLKAQINGISVEDGSGNNWILTVYFLDNEHVMLDHSGPYKLFFRTMTPRGGQVTDATPPDEQVRVHAGVIYRGSKVLGQIPQLAS